MNDSKWKLVKNDEPPKDGTKLLGAKYNSSFKEWEVGVIKWSDETFKVVPTRDFRLSFKPTHWKHIHLPKSPNT